MRKLIIPLFVFVGCSQGAQTTKPDPKNNAQPISSSAPTPKKAPVSASAPATIAAVVEPPKPVTASLPVDSEEVEEIEEKPAPIPKSETLIELPAASLPLKTFAMSGPYKTYDDYCKAAARTLDSWVIKNEEMLMGMADPSEKTKPEDVCPKGKRKKTDPESYEMDDSYIKELLRDEKPTSGAFTQIKLLHHQNMFDMMGRGSVEIAVQTKDGWYGAQLISYAPSWMGAGGAVQKERSLKELSVVDVIPGGEPELTMLINSYDDKGGRMADEGFKSKDLLFVCGVGASGRPSCYAPIRVAEEEVTNIYKDDEETLKKKIVSGWKMKTPYFKDGQLTLAPEEDKEEIPKRIKALFGAHPLSFP